MNQPVSDHQSQEQDNLIQNTSVSGNLTFAPVQIGTQIETQIIQISAAKITQQELIKSSPYQGLKRFNFRDSSRFFGRDKLINRLFEAVNRSNLSLVLGASGSGKSSVVRAGLIPVLKKSLESQVFYDFVFTPNQDPFDSLYRCLLNEEKDYSFNESEAEIALRAKADTLTQVIEHLQKAEERWLIFIDQFEELFTICDDQDKRKSFIQSLVQVAKSGNSSVKIILAMRSDFLEQFSFYPDLGQIANQNNVHLVTEMYPDELRQAIEQPAAKHGVVFEEGLVEQIITEVEGQKGYLPLLQYTLNLLWLAECQTLSTDSHPHIEDRTLNKKSYLALEGVRGALQKQVKKIYENLNQEEQDATKQIFLKLVNIVDTDSGSKIVSRRAYRNEFSNESIITTLDKFIEEKLLVSSNEYSNQDALQDRVSKHLKQSATVEIAHEILLSSWDTLKLWLEQEKEAIILRNWLSAETRRWLKIRSHHKSKAQDELLKGSRLAQVVGLRNQAGFQNIGGLSAEENQFIDTSVNWQKTQERQRKNRRRNAILSLTCFSVISLSLAAFATVQVRNVKVAEQLRQKDLIDSAWISLNPLGNFEKTLEGYAEKQEKCGTSLDFGLRDLYCKIKPFVDYRKLLAISGLPIFNQGPHSELEINLDGGYEFGYYNPEFLDWIQDKFIIDPDESQLKQQIQSAYNDKIKVVARAFYQSHKILFLPSEEFEAFKQEYEILKQEYEELLRSGAVNEWRFGDTPAEFAAIKSKYSDSINNKTIPAAAVGDVLQEDCRWLADYLATLNQYGYETLDEQENYWYLVNVSGGFWVRRSIDGTEKQFFEILVKLLEIYDSEWLHSQTSNAY